MEKTTTKQNAPKAEKTSVRINIEVPKALHTKAKLAAFTDGKTLQDWVLDKIEQGTKAKNG